MRGRDSILCQDSAMGIRKIKLSCITQTRQGCFATTEWHINRRTDNRPWIRYRDGIAGTKAYIDRLNS